MALLRVGDTRAINHGTPANSFFHAESIWRLKEVTEGVITLEVVSPRSRLNPPANTLYAALRSPRRRHLFKECTPSRRSRSSYDSRRKPLTSFANRWIRSKLTGLMLLSLPCHSCPVNCTVGKFFKEAPFMLKQNAEFLLEFAVATSNQPQIKDYLSVKSCHPTQYVSILVCTAEVSNFIFHEVCSLIVLYYFSCLNLLQACFLPLRFSAEFIICGRIFIQFYRGYIQCCQNESAR